MEALKKAERAKQEQATPSASQTSQPDGAADTADPELSLLSNEELTEHTDAAGSGDFPSFAAARETPETPSSIPDLAPLPGDSQNAAPARIKPTVSTLELALTGPAPMATPDIEPEARPQSAASPKPSASIAPARHVEAPGKAPPQDARKIAAEQQKAKTVFSAKQPARSRTLLLTAAAGAIVLLLAGFGVYYWQITSTSTTLLPAGTPQPTGTAAPTIDTGVPQQQQDASAEPAQNSVDKPAPASAQASPTAAPDDDVPARAESRSGSKSFKENPAIRIQQSAATSQLNPTLVKAYQSFLSGDTGTAQQLYRKTLQQEPNNRDALLGLAAIALKQKQAGQAAAWYDKLIELDPADPEALAGIVGLQGQSDPAQSESRLKKVLLQNPQADAANFALGNLYAQQSRWAEAQQSYFRAYSSAPGNADYAFNLAVSLDHLSQGKLALDYYQRALAQAGPVNFDKSSVQIRIKELLQAAGN